MHGAELLEEDRQQDEAEEGADDAPEYAHMACFTVSRSLRKVRCEGGCTCVSSLQLCLQLHPLIHRAPRIGEPLVERIGFLLASFYPLLQRGNLLLLRLDDAEAVQLRVHVVRQLLRVGLEAVVQLVGQIGQLLQAADGLAAGSDALEEGVVRVVEAARCLHRLFVEGLQRGAERAVRHVR